MLKLLLLIVFQPQVQDFEFHIGVLPPQRQMYYQLCDIDVPEISERLTGNKAEVHKLPLLFKDLLKWCDTVTVTVVQSQKLIE